jgi:dipeptidyl aminopeptidase/acylaminoacyl peptidase
VEALDGGDPEVEVSHRDEVFMLDAPFDGKPQSVFKSVNRFRYILWGTDKVAIAYDRWWNTRNTKTYLFNPSDATQQAEVLFDRNYQDRYNDPGSFVTKRNTLGQRVLAMKGKNAFLMGDGYTENGQFPFVDQFNLKTKKTTNIYRSEYTDQLENMIRFNPDEQSLMVRIESKNQYPNYYLRNLKTSALSQITDF